MIFLSICFKLVFVNTVIQVKESAEQVYIRR